MLSGKRIGHGIPFLEHIDITLEPGKLIGIIGPNGAGKTTLLKILAGLLAPDQGLVTLDRKEFSPSQGEPEGVSQNLYSLNPNQRARHIAYLAQHAFVHWPLSVHQLVDLGRFPHRSHGGHKSEADALIVAEVMQQVGVTDMAERSFNSLSGGERARVLLARALAVQADYLLVDEPIAALDLKYQLEIMELLALQASEHTGVCVILHDLNLAAAYCDELYLLDQGCLAARGKPEDVLTRQNLADIFDINATIRTTNGKLDIYPVSKKA